MMFQTDEWRDIPGYEGRYQISRMGEVRCWWWKGQMVSKPHSLHPYVRKAHGKSRRSGRRYVHLTNDEGTREVAVLNLMVDIWIGGRPPGMVAYHRNGDLADNCLHNIAFATPKALGKLTGAASKRRPVAKINECGEIVEVYTSAREAARRNHMSYQTVLDRCYGRVKNPYALDGHTYAFDDDDELEEDLP